MLLVFHFLAQGEQLGLTVTEVCGTTVAAVGTCFWACVGTLIVDCSVPLVTIGIVLW